MPAIQARQIRDSDRAAVAALLARGFPERPLPFWDNVLACLAGRPLPPELPRYGYLLESAEKIVGAILLIFSPPRGGHDALRCNVSSWYAEPAFRSYASLLVCKALSHRNVTYLNITPAPHTVKTLLAQGYAQHNGGIFVAAPALKLGSAAARVLQVGPDSPCPENGDPLEHELLREHARYGCLSLWCVSGRRATPFIFRPRTIKRFVPGAQLIYARHVDELVELARPIGRYLAARGRALLTIDANGPIPGLPGKYVDAAQRKYFKGPQRPALGDLAYTETAMFGI